MITRTFKLCLNAGTGSAPYINVSQYDEGETWLFELYSENGERYIPTTGAIVGVKSDGHGIVNTGIVDNEGRVVITETQQMTASAGRAIFELSIDGLTHGTANFIVAVERKPTDDAVMSDSDLSLIQEAIDSAEVIVEVIGDSDPSEVIGEHVDDWLDNHPEATTTVQDGAITAPKINSTLWDKLLVSEEASGNPASFDDGADDVPVSSLKVALEPIQLGSGDPSPSNVRPIIAANGKNMIGALRSESQTTYGVTVTPNGDGTFTANGTNTKGAISDFIIMTDALNLPVGDYIFNGGVYGTNGTGNTLYLTVRDANNQVRYAGNNGTSDTAFSIAEGDSISNVFIRFSANGTANNLVFKPMIRLASITDASYQPYQGIGVQQTGKNLIHIASGTRTQHGVTWVIDGNGTITSSGTSTDSSYTPNIENVILPSGTYTASVIGQNANIAMTLIKDGSWFRSINAGGTYTFTLSAPATISGFCTILPNLNASGTTYIMLEHGTTATAYEPFISTTYPYVLGGAVYGGSVDLATGVLTVNRILVDLDTLTTGWQTATVNGKAVLRRLVSAIKQDENKFYIKCSHLKYVGNTTGAVDNGTVTNLTSNYYNLTLCAPDLFTTQAELNAWTAEQKANGTPVQLSYLVDPTTVLLTPQEVKTLLGYNNISSSGTVDVIYHADTKLYVDKMTNVDNAIIAPTEADFVATRNYTVNDLLIVADTLYKVTANIASGSAITPNSNVQQTTLGALIKALS